MTEILDLPTMVLRPQNRQAAFKVDKTEDGWTLGRRGSMVRDGDVLRFDPFLKDDEEYIPGRTMCRRARQKKNPASQFHAEWLSDNQAGISPELRRFILVFTDTVWTGEGNTVISFLVWSEHDNRWNLRFEHIDRVFGDRYRIARIANRSRVRGKRA